MGVEDLQLKIGRAEGRCGGGPPDSPTRLRSRSAASRKATTRRATGSRASPVPARAPRPARRGSAPGAAPRHPPPRRARPGACAPGRRRCGRARWPRDRRRGDDLLGAAVRRAGGRTRGACRCPTAARDLDPPEARVPDGRPCTTAAVRWLSTEPSTSSGMVMLSSWPCRSTRRLPLAGGGRCLVVPHQLTPAGRPGELVARQGASRTSRNGTEPSPAPSRGSAGTASRGLCGRLRLVRPSRSGCARPSGRNRYNRAHRLSR